ncbi:chemotaxis protein CheB [Leptolyngbya sp. FACHB-36]|nr:chemotaxis protein CheB [Leptolyngbya sp. FACHB-36]
MFGRDVVVMGASAGGVEALKAVVQSLPADLQAAVFVAVHIPASSKSMLPMILSRSGPLPAVHAEDQATIEPGCIYIAPPDFHLIVERDRVRLSRGPRENGHRPAIDVLFRSASRAYGKRVIGIVLSGMLDDGAAGLAIIKRQGGVALVQDPNEALFDGMPNSAIAATKVDHILTASEIGAYVETLVQEPVAEDSSMTNDGLEQEARIVAEDKAARERGEQASGSPSPLTCPDCGGVLWELRDGKQLRYRCHTGHAYSVDSLASEQADALETALWSAIRVLEERAALARRMAVQAQSQNRFASQIQFEERADEAKKHADLVRQMVIQQHESQEKV